MSEDDDREFDEMLTDFLARELDPRLGGSERRFRRFLQSTAAAARTRRAWLIGAFAAGLAASVAALWATPLFRSIDSVRPTGPVISEARADAPVQPVIERFVSSQTSDEGILLLDDGTPVRVYHRRTTERTSWIDDHNAVHSEADPSDALVLVPVRTY